MKLFKAKNFAMALSVAALTSLVGCGGSGGGTNPVIDGVDGPFVEYVWGKVLLAMVLKNVSVDAGVTMPIPKYPNSTLQVGPDFNSAGTLISLTINGSDFLDNKGEGFDPTTLPGGRPLPGVASGSLPAIAIQIPSLSNSVLYVGPEVLGFFMPFSGLDTAGAIISFRFHNKAGAPVGTLSLVGADTNGLNAGLLALMNVDLLGLVGQKQQKATLYRYATQYGLY